MTIYYIFTSFRTFLHTQNKQCRILDCLLISWAQSSLFTPNIYGEGIQIIIQRSCDAAYIVYAVFDREMSNVPLILQSTARSSWKVSCGSAPWLFSKFRTSCCNVYVWAIMSEFKIWTYSNESRLHVGYHYLISISSIILHRIGHSGLYFSMDSTECHL